MADQARTFWNDIQTVLSNVVKANNAYALLLFVLTSVVFDVSKTAYKRQKISSQLTLKRVGYDVISDAELLIKFLSYDVATETITI
jgi:hypothetical protein